MLDEEEESMMTDIYVDAYDDNDHDISADEDSSASSTESASESSAIGTLITEADFAAALAAAGPKQLVVLDFTAEWCGPCKKLAPILEELAEKYAGPKVVFYKIDVPRKAGPGLVAARGVKRMPTLQFFVDGKQVQEIVGLDVPALKARLRKHTAHPIMRRLRSGEMLMAGVAAYVGAITMVPQLRPT